MPSPEVRGQVTALGARMGEEVLPAVLSEFHWVPFLLLQLLNPCLGPCVKFPPLKPLVGLQHCVPHQP